LGEAGKPGSWERMKFNNFSGILDSRFLMSFANHCVTMAQLCVSNKIKELRKVTTKVRQRTAEE
jgi:hypothetical protein